MINVMATYLMQVVLRQPLATSRVVLSQLKVTGESSVEIFATDNEVVYISSRVHVSNKLTRTKYSY